MKIVQVVESTATGTLSIVRLIANRFAEHGHEVHVIYSVRADTPAALGDLFDRRVALHHVQMSGAHALTSIVTLRRMLVRLCPDVIHLHSSLAGFIGRIATIATLADAVLLYSPHCISFMRRDTSAAKRRLFIMLERLAGIRPCRYVACSESERRAIRSHLGRPAEVIENAIGRTAAPPPSRQRSTAHSCEVVTAGGIRVQKNPRLFAEIARRMPDSHIRFTWIGDGDDTLRLKLAAAGVQVTGWLPHDAVTERLRSADIYLSTSTWEGMPVSLIEAMACGLAIVATRCAGNVDVIDPPRTGILFDDIDMAITMLGRLAGNPHACARLGAAARREARTRFDGMRLFRQLQDLYGHPPRTLTRPDSPE
ncbi:glycosyl transferase [Burkholderia stagnalis]|uniref:glycosyltransferase n=1 Tax=Burkholderia stagnalis TaxID=1503054 RepID=UPI00075CB04B|nr:glycosyltransferase [Burkholderia stagnalis]KVD93274.1 glycosyl transferase [Burkholderia stagnalis]KVO52811.1 glycosyl transferase [Burkholderia stagnalis]KVP06896.1 glycosyl transferase [Burkholderia stagnalis]KVW97679.1 glycosyl transferase [Burkholderia stagnalis]KWH83346.1 glycosyl transferase [Burkholderia stagnalis]